MKPRTAALLAALLAAASPALGVAADEGSFALRAVERDGDRVVLSVTNAGFDAVRVRASLLAGGTVVALPEATFDYWHDGVTRAIAFDLERDVEAVELLLRYADTDDVAHEQTIALRLPVDHGRPRLEVVDASLYDNTTANFTLENVGARRTSSAVAALRDASGVGLGVPFRQTVPPLGPGERTNLSFELARRAVRDVVLTVEHDGASRDTRVWLRNGTEAPASGGVAARTDLPYRDADAGQDVDFPLRLTNEGRARTLAFRAEGLPPGFDARFYVGQSGVTSLALAAGEAKDLRLTLDVPSTAGRDGAVSVPFRVALLDGGEEVGAIDLSLTLRGRGRLDLRGENWFTTVAPGATRTVEIEVGNPGTAPLLDVLPAAATPAGWRIAFEPSRMPRIDAGAVETLRVTLTTPEDAAEGRYVVELSAANEDTAARSRSLSVEVAAPASSGVGWIVAAGLAGVAALALVVKIKRK